MKKRKSRRVRTLKVAGEFVIALAIAMALSGTMIGLFYAGKYAYDAGYEYFTRKEPVRSPSPGELVDKAMAIPGAFVIGPRRDLVEMGALAGLVEPRYVGGPAIAIRTKRKWCIWSLGFSAVKPMRPGSSYGMVSSDYAGDIIGSGFYGFEGAYEKFLDCITAGNTINPIKHHGAKCDGKHNDTRAIRASVKEAAEVPMGVLRCLMGVG